MSIRGNSGFFNNDKRFGTNSSDTEGGISREQHFLERLNGRLNPSNGGVDVIPTLHYDSTENLNEVFGDVVSWTDKVNNVLAVAPEFPNSPEYVANSPLFNNNPILRFNGEYLETGFGPLLDTVGGMTLYFVFKYTPQTTGGFSLNTLLARTNGTTWTQGWGIQFYDGDVKFWLNNWNTESSNIRLNIPNSTTPHIYKLHYDESQITCEIIGLVPDFNTKPYSTPITEADSGIEIGRAGSQSYTTNGDMAEIMYFNTPITTSQQISVEDYLKTKYNIN